MTNLSKYEIIVKYCRGFFLSLTKFDEEQHECNEPCQGEKNLDKARSLRSREKRLRRAYTMVVWELLCLPVTARSLMTGAELPKNRVGALKSRENGAD